MLVFIFQSNLVVFHVKSLCDYNAQLMIIAQRNLVLEYPQMLGKISPFLNEIIYNLYLSNQSKGKPI